LSTKLTPGGKAPVSLNNAVGVAEDCTVKPPAVFAVNAAAFWLVIDGAPVGMAKSQVLACDVSTVAEKTVPETSRDDTQGSGDAPGPGPVHGATIEPSLRIVTLDGLVPDGSVVASMENEIDKGLSAVAFGALIISP
jgi:hypothetical protein